MSIEKATTLDEITEFIKKMKFPKPLISSDEAAKRATDRFTAKPAMNHCAPSVIMTLAEAYDLPQKDLLPWIANGFQGGVCSGEICGALSGAAICLGLLSYKVSEPKNDHMRRIAAYALAPYMQDLEYAFYSTFGSIRCGKLTKRLERSSLEAEKYFRLRLWEAKCTPFVEFVVRKMVVWGELGQAPPPLPTPGTPPLKLDDY
jgi:C_GCAxxG_C_C family probable redox protein